MLEMSAASGTQKKENKFYNILVLSNLLQQSKLLFNHSFWQIWALPKSKNSKYSQSFDEFLYFFIRLSTSLYKNKTSIFYFIFVSNISCNSFLPKFHRSINVDSQMRVGYNFLQKEWDYCPRIQNKGGNDRYCYFFETSSKKIKLSKKNVRIKNS